MSIEDGRSRPGPSPQELPTAPPANEAGLSEEALARIAAALADPAVTPAAIRHYRLTEIIGMGGMGEVWRAEQDHPIRRTVALKLLKLGTDTRQVIARFAAERQALAMMNHPNVAKVLDAGASDTGRPYFVMEYVTGETITAFCDRHRYTVKQRLQLFAQACAAVGHAHQKGILHRDLKPGNILVTDESGEAQVKVIDFGIAKALQPTADDRMFQTIVGQPIGTPEYMSPEQALSDGQDVDTRSDIYSLGVVLYELLAGALPFDSKDLRASGVAQMQRILRDVDPPRPSTRLDMLGDTEVVSIASLRQTQRRELAVELRTELEWIPLKAMRKERSARYTTAAEIAQDIQNYLDSKPLIAGPESRIYRFRKFVRRRRAEVIAASLVLISLVVGIIGTTTFAIRASRSAAETRQVADFQAEMLTAINVRVMGQRLRDDVLAEATSAWRQARLGPDEIARRGDELRSLLSDANFTNTAVHSLDRNIFDPSLLVIERDFAAKPEVRARLLQQVARTMRELGLTDRAAAPQAKALEIRRQVLGSEHPDTLLSIDEAGFLFRAQAKWEQAEACALEALQTRRRVGGESRLILRSILFLCDTLARQGRLEEAQRYAQENLDGCMSAFREKDRQTLFARCQLGQVLMWRRMLDDAEPYIVEARQRSEQFLPHGDTDTLRAMMVLGTLRMLQGNLREAESLFRDTLRGYSSAQGDAYRETLFSGYRLAQVLRLSGDLSEAEMRITTALEGFRSTLGPDHVDTLLAEEEIAKLREAENHLDEAETRFAALYRRAESLRGIDAMDAARLMSAYGTFMAQHFHYAEADVPLRESYRRLKETHQERHEYMRAVVSALAEVCDHTSRPDEAREWRAQLATLRATTRPATAPDT